MYKINVKRGDHVVFLVCVFVILGVIPAFASPYALQNLTDTNSTSGNIDTINNPSDTINPTIDTSSISDNSWYPGKGLKQGDYFRYNVCWTDWHNCAPLQMNFWVKNETSDASGWNVVLLAVDGSIIQKGVMTIGKITPDPTSFDSNISDYAGVYRSTISWLDSYANRDFPKTFDIQTWGKTGSVGEQSVGPIDKEQVTVGAGTFDTWVIGWHTSIDNKIWVDPNLAFPVKSNVYVDTTTGTPHTDYTLELLQTGNSQTEPAFLQVSSQISTTPTQNSDTSSLELLKQREEDAKRLRQQNDQNTTISSPQPNNSTGNPDNPYIHTQNQTSVTLAPKIPNWVKAVFGYYAQGNLSDDDLIKALQFLIQQGIIKVS